MSVRINLAFYFDILPADYLNGATIARAIHRFLSNTYKISSVNSHRNFWTVHFTDPKSETLFYLKYSDYIC